MEAGLRSLLIFPSGLCQCRLCGDGLHCAVDAVVARDAIKMPLNDLGHGVAMLPIERMQTIDRDIEQIPIHLRRGCGVRGKVWRLCRQSRHKEKKYRGKTHTRT